MNKHVKPESPEPETVLVDHPPSEALERMRSSGARHLCVVDGDLVIGVVQQDRLARRLAAKDERGLQEFMDKRVLILPESLRQQKINATLASFGVSYALIVDDELQVRGVAERDGDGGEAEAAPEARVIELSADMQQGARSGELKVYSAHPHIEEEQGEPDGE